MTLLVEKPERADWWLEMERKYSHFVSEGKREKIEAKPPYYFFRGQISLMDLIEDSKFPFEKDIDKNKVFDNLEQMRLWDYELDSTDGCTESCEVF
jgi:hypothetical protein